MKMNLTFRYMTLFMALCLALLSGAAHALELRQAKQDGYVGEQPNGYLGVVKAAPGVQELVNKINGLRKEHYQKIAAQNGTSLNVVETLAGKKAIEKTPPNQYVRDPSGNWIRK